MHLCLDCGAIFEDPQKYTEAHDLPFPPYETWSGCPRCGGAYAETICCDLCGEWVVGEYIKLKDGTVVCDQCYEINDIGD